MEVGTTSAQMLPYAASSVGLARRRLIAELSAAGVYETTACDAGLVLSELISNALRHASPLPGSVVRVRWELGDGYVELAVSDGGGATEPRVNQPAANAVGGRGLGIVDRLSLRWGVRSDPDGSETTVWAALPLAGEAAQHAGAVQHAGAAQYPVAERGGQRGAERGPRGHNGTGPDLVIASSRDA
jgi:anti-sigma regulatory factor (Ser/Thr protein kinase)